MIHHGSGALDLARGRIAYYVHRLGHSPEWVRRQLGCDLEEVSDLQAAEALLARLEREVAR